MSHWKYARNDEWLLFKKILKLWKNKLAFELASQEYSRVWALSQIPSWAPSALRTKHQSLKSLTIFSTEDPASPLEANCITCIYYLAALHINVMSERQHPTLTVQCFQEARGKRRNSTRKNMQPLNSVWLLDCVDIQALQAHYRLYMAL